MVAATVKKTTTTTPAKKAEHPTVSIEQSYYFIFADQFYLN